MTFDRRSFIRSAVGGAFALGLAPAMSGALAAAPRPEVFGHRGASALRPEHTLASYAKAIADGADFIEPDLVATRDGVLVARHDVELTETTDVARRPEFAARRTTKTIDGQTHTGWFADDFTLAELKTLRAVERLARVRTGNTLYDGQFEVPTWDEIVAFTAAQSATLGRPIGLVPELKSSSYFAARGLALEDRLLRSIDSHDYTRRAPLVIQSFETVNLQYLRGKLGKRANIRLMQLIGDAGARPADSAGAAGLTYARMLTPDGLRTIAAYADIVAPQVRLVIPLQADGRLGAPTTLVADAHRAGLQIQVWTFRPENRFLAADFRDANGENARNEAGSVAEIRRYLAEGIDGFFTDDPGLGRIAAGL